MKKAFELGRSHVISTSFFSPFCRTFNDERSLSHQSNVENEIVDIKLSKCCCCCILMYAHAAVVSVVTSVVAAMCGMLNRFFGKQTDFLHNLPGRLLFLSALLCLVELAELELCQHEDSSHQFSACNKPEKQRIIHLISG